MLCVAAVHPQQSGERGDILLAADTAPAVDPCIQLPPHHAPLAALHAAAAAGRALVATVRPLPAPKPAATLTVRGAPQIPPPTGIAQP